MEEDVLIIRYDSNTGEILSYGVVGFRIPDEIPADEGYIHWQGIEPKPKYDYRVQDGAVVLRSDAERQSYQDEVLARSLRGQRDTLLAQSDYVILPDAPYSSDTQSAYRTYRQELRDLPAQAGFPNNICLLYTSPSPRDS